jgi:hypothetical protein
MRIRTSPSAIITRQRCFIAALGDREPCALQDRGRVFECKSVERLAGGDDRLRDGTRGFRRTRLEQMMRDLGGLRGRRSERACRFAM